MGVIQQWHKDRRSLGSMSLSQCLTSSAVQLTAKSLKDRVLQVLAVKENLSDSEYRGPLTKPHHLFLRYTRYTLNVS